MDYVFIAHDESVRAWLLSNPMVDNPLEHLVYCYSDQSSERQDIPALSRLDYPNANNI